MKKWDRVRRFGIRLRHAVRHPFNGHSHTVSEGTDRSRDIEVRGRRHVASIQRMGLLKFQQEGDVLAINVETGDFVIAESSDAATKLFRATHRDAPMYLHTVHLPGP